MASACIHSVSSRAWCNVSVFYIHLY